MAKRDATTLLLTWNPQKWEFTKLKAFVADLKRGKPVKYGWRTGTRRGGIAEGDRFFLLRQGKGPRGIVGSGEIASEVYSGRLDGERANFVAIRFDSLIDAEATPELVLGMDEIRKALGSGKLDAVRSSGQRLEPADARKLARAWREVADIQALEAPPGTLDAQAAYVEGAIKRTRTNRYERDPRARARCIDIYGCKCYVCGMDFGKVYGDLGKGFITVHHETPVSRMGRGRRVDPEKDMKPVCPNCHAMIHRYKDALGIAEVRKALKPGRRR